MTNMTSWCKTCYNIAGTMSEDTCNACQGFLTTKVMCPGCGGIDKYNGSAAPDRCDTCYRALPNINRLKEEENARVEYSIC